MVKSIVAPVDFSDGSLRAARYAAALAAQFDARLALLHVGAQVTDTEELHGLRDVYHKAREEEQRIARRRMDDLVAELSSAHDGLAVETFYESGVPHDAICALAEKLGADMIVMGTAGLTGLSHFFVGSTAERVVRLSAVPVLTVPRAPR